MKKLATYDTIKKLVKYLKTDFLAPKAKQLNKARAISLTGDITGSATFDGTADVNINSQSSIFRQPNTSYQVGDMVYIKGAGVKYYLLCVTAGTTAETDIDMTGVADGSSIADGTVVWTIRKITTVEIPNASSTVAGIMKLYSSKGTNTDGAMTQQAITNELGNLRSLIGSGGGIIAASLTANGYIKFANGVIIEWGIRNASDNGYWTYPLGLSTVYAASVNGSVQLPAGNYSGSKQSWLTTVTATRLWYRTDTTDGVDYFIIVGKA